MKKQIIKRLSILASVIAISNGVNANEIKPYIGIGYQMSNIRYGSSDLNISGSSVRFDLENHYEKELSNFNLFAGFKMNKNLAIEIGYFKSKEEDKKSSYTSNCCYWWDINLNTSFDAGEETLDATSASKLQIINIDAIYNYPINYINGFNFLALAGISKVDFDTKINFLVNDSELSSGSDDQNGYGLNLGLGLEANIYQNISLRGLIKYTTVNGIDYFDDLVNYSLGVKYQF